MMEKPKSKGWSPLKIVWFTVPVLGVWVALIACIYLFRGPSPRESHDDSVPEEESVDVSLHTFAEIVKENRLAPWPGGATGVELTAAEGEDGEVDEATGFFYSKESSGVAVLQFFLELKNAEEKGAFQALIEERKVEVRRVTDKPVVQPSEQFK
jgi:hypothetical protein